MWSAVFLALIAFSAAAEVATNPAKPTDPTTIVAHCPTGDFSRADCIACMLDATDRNHDGRISADEMEQAKQDYLYWYERWLVALSGGAANIMAQCDANGDGFITYDDMLRTEVTCLPLTDANGNQLDGLCKVKKYLCDRATEILGHHVYKK